MNLKLASEKLKVGEVYSRKSLREIFPTSDATLNTGVFRPKNYSSVWLFVTRKKASEPAKVRRLPIWKDTSLAGTNLRQKRSDDH